MQNLNGQKLGNYELRERLGRGGMAEVYKAYQASMDRFVAVKVMLGHLATDDNFIERFKREAQAVGRLRHPHIIQIFDFGIQDDIYYMAMEHVTGGNLREYIIDNKKLPLSDSLKIAHDLADALIYAHNAGMIHRDLKPANVMFIDKATHNVVLTDFGIARILGAVGITGSGMSVGTPSYMSPEAGRGEDIDERADIYALGIILYEMLVGKVPYDADTPLAVILKHISAPLPTRADYGENIPEEIERIILKCLAKDRDDRYASATDLRDDLTTALNIVPNLAETESVQTPQAKTEIATKNATHLDDDAPTTMASSDEVNATITSSTDNPILKYAIGVIALLVILGGLYAVFGGANASEPLADTPIAEIIASNTVESVTESNTDTPDPTAISQTVDTPPLIFGGTLPPNTQNLNLLTNISPMLDTVDTMILAGNPQEAIDYLDAILAETPNNTEVLFARSQVYSLGYDEENLSGQDAIRLIELEPDNIYGHIALYDSWLNYPAQGQEGAVDAALRAIEQAYELDPENPHVLWRLGRISDWEIEGERMYSAEDLGASGYRFINTMGLFLYNSADDYERAIPYFETYLRGTDGSFLENEGNIWNLASALIQADRSEDALALVSEHIDLNDTTDAILIMDVAYVAYRAGDYEQARDLVNSAIAFNPDVEPAGSYLLALLTWHIDGDSDLAIEQLTALEGVEFYSNFLFIVFEHDINIDRARILTDAGQLEEALVYYNLALENYDYTAWLYEERADIHIELNDIASARADLQTAFDISEDATYRSELRDRILVLTENDSD